MLPTLIRLGDGDLELLEVERLLVLLLLLLLLLLLVDRDSEPDLLAGPRLLLILLLPECNLEGRDAAERGRGGGEVEVGGAAPLRTTTFSSAYGS